MTVFRFMAALLSLAPPGLLLLALPACVAVPEAPANAPHAAAPVPPEMSVISIPVSIDLEQVGGDLMRQLPRPLLRSTQRRPLPVRLRSLHTSIATEPGVCSLTQLSCLAHNSVRTVSADRLATADAEVTQEMQLRSLAMSMEGSRFTLNAQVELEVSTRLGPEMEPLGKTACGGKGAKPRFELQQGGHVSWSPQGEVVVSPGAYSVRWLRPCNITAFASGVESLLDLPALRDQLQDAVERQVLNRLRQDSLRQSLERAWPELNTPRELRPGVWLLPHPENVAFGELVGKGRHISTAVLVHARPEIVMGARPDVVVPPLPTPERGIGGAEGMRLAVRGDVALAEAERQLRLNLGGALRMVNGREVRLGQVRLWGNGERAVLGLAFEAPLLAELYLFARPVYDLERNEVSFVAIEFSPASRAYLGRAAPWLPVPGLLSAVQAEARFRFDEGLAGALRDFRELRLAAGQDMMLHGGVQRVQPQALYFTRDRLVALLLLEGRLALEARQR